MAYQVLLSTSAFDAVAYARQMSNDTDTPYVTPDAAYELYQEDVVEDFSRYVPLDYIVGNPAVLTSALTTVANQQRYVCSVANGFSVEPARITDVSYNSSGLLTNTTDWGALNLMPFSPLGRFFLANTWLVDNPSMLTMRSEYRDTVDRLFPGFYNVVRDPTTGLLAIDLYPIPTVTGQPIYVRYQGNHIDTGTAGVNAIYLTVPEALKRYFAILLYCTVVENNLDEIARAGSTRAGILQEGGSPEWLERKLARLRASTYQALGGTFPVVVHTA